MLDKVCRVYVPFLEVQTSRVDKRVHLASAVDSFAGFSHVAPRSIVRASSVDRRLNLQPNVTATRAIHYNSATGRLPDILAACPIGIREHINLRNLSLPMELEDGARLAQEVLDETNQCTP